MTQRHWQKNIVKILYCHVAKLSVIMNSIFPSNLVQRCKQKFSDIFKDTSNSGREIDKEDQRQQSLIDLRDEDNFLILLMVSVLFSVSLPLIVIASPYLLLDSSVIVIFTLLVLAGPIMLLMSSNVRSFLPPVFSECIWISIRLKKKSRKNDVQFKKKQIFMWFTIQKYRKKIKSNLIIITWN